MSDDGLPSYRVRAPRRGPSLGLTLGAVGALAVALVVGASVWSLTGASGEVPVIAADERPVKVRPGDPGGLRVPNQDETIFERRPRGAAVPAPPGLARLAPEDEGPSLDRLRAAVAPPVPAAPAAAAPPPALTTATDDPPPEAAAPAPAPPAAAPPARPSGRVQVQLGAVPSEEGARAEWERLRRRVPELAGRQPAITRLDREGQAPLWRLRTAGFADVAAARAFCAALRERSIACSVPGSGG